MVAASSKEFQYLSVIKMDKGQYGVFYQARLNRKLGRKTIGLGDDRIQALNLALMVDEEIQRLVINDLPIEIDSLKAIVENQKEITKARKEGKLQIVEKDSLAALWEKYVNFHQSIGKWEQSYYLTTIKTVTSMVERSPVQKLEHKQELVEWIFSDDERSPKTSKDRFKLIVAAIDWNSKQGNIPRKWGIEYRDLLSSIQLKSERKSSIQDEEEVDIFQVAEIEQILEAMKCDRHSRFSGKHSQYYRYAYFCWLTGCRPSEAIALKWENVDLAKKRIKFCEGQVNASGKIIKKKGTKTVPFRFFPINPGLEELLTSIPHRKGYVFLNKSGKPIAQQSFRGIWVTLLGEMGIRYRTPYQLRHSMISYHANNDYPIHKLAEIVGNSEEIIKEHYLKLDIERISLPDVIKPE
jgi:integrase